MNRLILIAAVGLGLLSPTAAYSACSTLQQARAAAPGVHLYYKVVGSRHCWYSKSNSGARASDRGDLARVAPDKAAPRPIPLPRPAPRMIAFAEFSAPAVHFTETLWQPLYPSYVHTIRYRWSGL